MNQEPLFQSFFMAGFECSTHQRVCGKRLDLIASTKHDLFCRQDYGRLAKQGLMTVREGLRWHLIEARPGRYDFSSALPMIQSARTQSLQVIWDLCHYGWPEHLDIFQPEFVSAFADFAASFARLLQSEMEGPFFFTPINEISFFSWAGAEKSAITPYAYGRGLELKAQLVLAAIAATEAIRAVIPDARFITVDPLINVVPDPRRTRARHEAEAYRTAQFQGWDMLSGRVWPLLGGKEEYLDIVGVNYYPHNQWIHPGKMIPRSHPHYRPFREMLAEVWERYRRPLFIAETGTESRSRVSWFRYVCEEVLAAIEGGVPIHGICLYPIVNHPGWVDDRHCPNGLWGYPDEHGERKIYAPLAAELKYYRQIFEKGLRPETAQPQLIDGCPVLEQTGAAWQSKSQSSMESDRPGPGERA